MSVERCTCWRPPEGAPYDGGELIECGRAATTYTGTAPRCRQCHEIDQRVASQIITVERSRVALLLAYVVAEDRAQFDANCSDEQQAKLSALIADKLRAEAMAEWKLPRAK